MRHYFTKFGVVDPSVSEESCDFYPEIARWRCVLGQTLYDVFSCGKPRGLARVDRDSHSLCMGGCGRVFDLDDHAEDLAVLRERHQRRVISLRCFSCRLLPRCCSGQRGGVSRGVGSCPFSGRGPNVDDANRKRCRYRKRARPQQNS